MINPLLDTTSLPRFAEIAPEHVLPAIRDIIASHRQMLDELLDAAENPDFNSLVTPLEDMEHELSRVWSPVSHLQSVLGSGEWREAYNEALPLLTQHATEVSQNTRLQKAYAAVESKLDANASTAQKSVVEHALRDFHLSGVDLPEKDKARFKEIMQQLAKTQAAFEHNIQDASDAWSLHVDDDTDLAGLPRQAIERAAAEAREKNQQGWLLTLDYPTYDAVIRHADNRELRETFYRAWVTRASDQGDDEAWNNTDNIASILALRYEAARLVGFENFAEYSLATKMAKTPEEVINFLQELARHSREAAKRELEELAELAGDEIRPWDAAFWL